MAEIKRKKRYRVTGTKTIYSYAYLFSISRGALKEGQSKDRGRFYDFLVSMLFCAFSLESYLNHIGQLKLEWWDDNIRRSLSPEQKLKILDKTLKLNIDTKTKPFKSFGSIFRFRKLIVHAKTENMASNSIQELGRKDLPKMPKPEWQRMVNENNAKLFVQDTERIIQFLNNKLGFQKFSDHILEDVNWEATPF